MSSSTAARTWQNMDVEYNPLTVQARELSSVLRAQRSEADSNRELLAWYDALDAETAVADAEAAVARLKEKLEGQRTTVAAAQAKIERLRPLAWAQWYFPAYLAFASVRGSGKAYKEAKRELAAAAARVPATESEHLRALEAAAEAHAELERHRQVDRDATTARLRELEDDIASTAPAYEAVAARAVHLEEKLAPVGAALRKVTGELERLRQQLDLAGDYINDLDRASDGRARYAIHKAAELELGTGKPGRFIAQNRGYLDRLERDVGKLEDRVRDIVRQNEIETDVRRLIVDGSNLCHAGSEVVGLFALRALLPHLLKGREVVVIFDATITRLLHKNEAMLKADLPDAQVRVVESKTKADKLILRLADEPGKYVLSNDKYRDYPELKDVVEARLINVEIVGDRAIIDDMGIDVTFSRVK